MRENHIGFTPWSTKWRNGELHRLNWDIYINNREYFGYHLSIDFDNYDESEKEQYQNREDTWFVCERDCPEDQIIKNLVRWSHRDLGPLWEIRVAQYAYTKEKWGEELQRTGVHYTIYLNDEEFTSGCWSTLDGAYIEAQHIIHMVEDSPCEVGSIDWRENLRGRKIWYRDQPAIIDHAYGDSVYIVPDLEAIKEFKSPESWKEDDWLDWSDYANGLTAEIWSDNINWFRKVAEN